MFRRRLHRLRTLLLVLLSLLVSQQALASYICPAQPDAAAMAAMAEAGLPCSGMDEAQPVLCHQHAADAAQTFEPLKLPSAAPPALVLVLALPPLHAAPASAAMPPTATSEAQPPPDPLFLATLRLRV
jgi:hypothetical protein